MPFTLDLFNNSTLMLLKGKYLRIFETEIVDPLRKDVLRHQVCLQKELDGIACGTNDNDDNEKRCAMLERELEETRKALRLIELEVARLAMLRLSDLELEEKMEFR